MKYTYLLLLLATVLSGCWFRKSSRKQDCARAAYENILYKYERDISLLEAMQQASDKETILRLGNELKDEILLKNEEFNDEQCSGWFGKKNETANYPFTQYKINLDCNINLLERTKTSLYWKQEGLGKSIQDLIEQLDRLRKYVVLHQEYSHERNMLERRKILEIEKSARKKAMKPSKSSKK